MGYLGTKLNHRATPLENSNDAPRRPDAQVEKPLAYGPGLVNRGDVGPMERRNNLPLIKHKIMIYVLLKRDLDVI